MGHGYSGSIDTFSKQDGFMVVQGNFSISKASQYVHTTEQDDVQLDVSLVPKSFHHGMYFGEGEGGVALRNRFRALLKTRGDDVSGSDAPSGSSNPHRSTQ